MNQLAEELGNLLLQNGLKVTAAESCTGGGVAAAITDVAGSSAWFDAGFVTYSNQAKTQMLQVDSSLFETEGAVSCAVVEAMSLGALIAANADLAVAVSGVAGPGGGSEDKPVGTVWISWRSHEKVVNTRFQFGGDRAEVRQQTVVVALKGMIDLVTTGRVSDATLSL